MPGNTLAVVYSPGLPPLDSASNNVHVFYVCFSYIKFSKIILFCWVWNSDSSLTAVTVKTKLPETLLLWDMTSHGLLQLRTYQQCTCYTFLLRLIVGHLGTKINPNLILDTWKKKVQNQHFFPTFLPKFQLLGWALKTLAPTEALAMSTLHRRILWTDRQILSNIHLSMAVTLLYCCADLNLCLYCLLYDQSPHPGSRSQHSCPPLLPISILILCVRSSNMFSCPRYFPKCTQGTGQSGKQTKRFASTS